MLWAASILLSAIYLLLPILSVGIALRAPPAVKRFVVSGWISGAVLAAVILAAYATGIGGQIPAGQAALAVYFGVGLLLFLKTIDMMLTHLLRRALLRKKPGPGRRMAVASVRAALFGAFALPWVMAAVMVYRPKVVAADVTQAPGGERVTFTASDGGRTVGLYLPAETASDTTVLLCHGLGGTRAGFARMIGRLHDAGIGVLAIDMRAHGESGGQLCTFGVAERNDALGAVGWLKAEHPNAAGRVIGVGASLGAAALLAAAAQEPRIEGVVVLSTYATLVDEVNDVSRGQLVPPIGWLMRHFGLPIASLHVGHDLRRVRPIDDVTALWPRPVLVVHGTDDAVIPFDHGRRIYDAAPIGRSSFWVRHGTHNGILDHSEVIDRVVDFIRGVRPTPLV